MYSFIFIIFKYRICLNLKHCRKYMSVYFKQLPWGYCQAPLPPREAAGRVVNETDLE